jgi:hypothetical protein
MHIGVDRHVVDLKASSHRACNHVAVKQSTDAFLSFKLKTNELKKYQTSKKINIARKFFKERGK